MINQKLLALDPTICQLTNLLGIKTFPSFCIELFKKLQYEHRINKIYEGITNITLILYKLDKYKVP